MRIKIIVWLVACSVIRRSHSMPSSSADLWLGSARLKPTGRGNEAGSRDLHVPEFMVKLYKSVETGNRQLSVGNTVRSIAGQFSMFYSHQISRNTQCKIYNYSVAAIIVQTVIGESKRKHYMLMHRPIFIFSIFKRDSM